MLVHIEMYDTPYVRSTYVRAHGICTVIPDTSVRKKDLVCTEYNIATRLGLV